VTPWCLVLKIKFIGAALWIGMACAKIKSNIIGDAVVFGTEILAGKYRELRCALHCCLLLNEFRGGV
jgi:hypothetical protein